jgi:hypothetical protein
MIKTNWKIIGEISFFLIPLIISIFALIQSYKANSLSASLKQIEVARDKLDYKKGEYALLNLLAKYFILNYQRTEFKGTLFRVKTQSPFIENYIEEIENLAHEYDNLTNSSFYLKLYKNYPFIGSVGIFLRKEKMFIKNSISEQKEYGYDNDVWSKMFDAFSLMRNEILSDKEMVDAKTIIDSKEIQDIFVYAKNVNNSITK